MSLNDWSLLVLCSTLLFYLATYFAMFAKPHVGSFAFAFFIWLISIGVKLVYGLVTDQIGFVLLFFLDILMLFFVFIIAERLISDNSDD